MSASGPRTRQRGVFASGNLTITETILPPNPNPGTNVNNYIVNNYGIEERMTDYVTPTFKVLRSQGYIVNNRLNKTFDKKTYSKPTLTATVTHGSVPGSHILVFSGDTGVYFDDPVVGPFRNAPGMDLVNQTIKTIDEKPLQKSAAYQARNKISPIFVQSLVSLAEMNKTINMIFGVATTLRNLRRAIVANSSPNIIYQILGGKFPKAAKRGGSLDPITNRWLEYRYGWTPLVMELQGALKALDKTRKIKLRGTARGKASKVWRSEHSHNINPMFGAGQGPLGNCDLLFVQHETVECRAYAMFEISQEFQTARDFGFTEVPLAMWELVPFSFIVDWFLPIGDWLEAVTPKLGVKILAEGITTRRTTFLHREVTAWNKNPGAVSYDLTGATGLVDTREYVTLDREPKLSDVLYAFPSIDVKLNVKRVLDSLALLNQTRRSR
jgi:hypothetical protein